MGGQLNMVCLWQIMLVISLSPTKKKHYRVTGRSWGEFPYVLYDDSIDLS